MRVAVDGYEVKNPLGGVGRITVGLVSALAARQPDLEIVLFSRQPTGLSFCGNVIERVLSPDPGYTRWQNQFLRKALKKIQPDIFLAPNYTLPIGYRSPSVLFEHDISFVSHPEWYSQRDVLKTRFLIPHSLRRASMVVTESEFSRQEILAHFPFVPPDRIRVVYPGLEKEFQPSSPDVVRAWKRDKGLTDKKMIGFLGSIFNRRHIPELVEAVRRLRQTIPDSFLYIVGRDRTCPAQNIADLVQEDWILWEQGLEDRDLPVFYSGCDVFVYLSAYEGFGLPPLEALACGTVPLILNRTSLAEVYRDMAVLVEDPDPEQVRAGLELAVSDKYLKPRLLDRFSERRSLFAWDQAGEKISGIIQEIAGTPGP